MKRKLERIEDSCADVSLDALSIDQDKQHNLIAKEQEDNRHPTPEQLLIREAVKWLTPAQRKVWELHNYDRLTQDEIAKKLDKKRTTIETQIHQCEARIAKWIKSNMGAYELLKSDLGKEE